MEGTAGSGRWPRPEGGLAVRWGAAGLGGPVEEVAAGGATGELAAGGGPVKGGRGEDGGRGPAGERAAGGEGLAGGMEGAGQGGADLRERGDGSWERREAGRDGGYTFMDAKEYGVDALDSLPSPRIADYGKLAMQNMLRKHFHPKIFNNSSINFVDSDLRTLLSRLLLLGLLLMQDADTATGAGGEDNQVGSESIQVKITRAAVAALAINLERTKLGDKKDLEC
ncbi:hypothetical protein ZWY2020_049092 [Hordeum vulgare]|nr:hypothetical protein ZWY2020_049092 [Hordeum vulgare]